MNFLPTESLAKLLQRQRLDNGSAREAQIFNILLLV